MGEQIAAAERWHERPLHEKIAYVAEHLQGESPDAYSSGLILEGLVDEAREMEREP